MDLFSFLSFLILGGFAGFLAGLVGIGGTSLMTPALIWLLLKTMPLDTAVKTAFGSALSISALTAATGFLLHKKKVTINWRLLLVLTAAVMTGAFLGSSIASRTRGCYLVFFLSAALFIVSTYLLFAKDLPETKQQDLSLSTQIIAGLGIGFTASLAGLGGAIFTIIVFSLVFKYSMHQILGISSFVQIFGAVSGAAGYIRHGYVNYYIVLAMAISGIPLARYGASLAHRLNGRSLRKIFGGLLLVLSGLLIIKIC